MKYLKIALSIMIISFIAACKKEITMADMVGRWEEVSPCIYPSQCYSLEFTSDNLVISYSPYQTTSHYYLRSKNKIQLSDTVSAGNGAYSVRTLDIIANDKEDIIIKDFRPLVTQVPGDPTFKDIHLKKRL